MPTSDDYFDYVNVTTNDYYMYVWGNKHFLNTRSQ